MNKDYLIASLGGTYAVRRMGPEARADAMGDFLSKRIDGRNPTVAEVEEQIETLPWRSGAGFLFVAGKTTSAGCPRCRPIPQSSTSSSCASAQAPPETIASTALLAH